MKKCLFTFSFITLSLLNNCSHSKAQEIKILANQVNVLPLPAIKDHCFTPPLAGEQPCKEKILERIRQANIFIVVAMYAFTDNEIAKALVDASRPPRNVPITVLIDKRWYVGSTSKTAIDILKRGYIQPPSTHIPSMVTVVEKYLPFSGIYHHKVIVTGEYSEIHGAQRFSLWLGTGSYNYTYPASNINQENYVFINEAFSGSENVPHTFTLKYLKGIDGLSSTGAQTFLSYFWNEFDFGDSCNATQIQQAESQSGSSSLGMLYNLSTQDCALNRPGSIKKGKTHD